MVGYKGEGKTAAVNGTVISTADLPEGISEVYVRGVDNNPVPEQALAGEISSIKILKDTKAPVLHVTYPTAIEEVEGIPKWEISDVVSITNIEEARLQSVKISVGPEISILGQDMHLSQTLYEWIDGVHAPIAYPLDILLNQIPYQDGKFKIVITVTDQSGNTITEEKSFYLLTNMKYNPPDFTLRKQGDDTIGSLIHITEVPVVLNAVGDVFQTDIGYVAKLVVNGELVSYQMDEENKQISINVLDEKNQSIFKPGQWLPLRMEVEYPTADDTIYSYATFTDDGNAVKEDKVSDLENIEFTDGKLVLQADTGSFIYHGPTMGPGQLSRIQFERILDEGLPNGTKLDILLTTKDKDGNTIGHDFIAYDTSKPPNAMGYL